MKDDRELTLGKDLGAYRDESQARVRGDGYLLLFVVGRGHPVGVAAAVHQRLGREDEDVIQHGEEAIGLLGRYEVGIPARRVNRSRSRNNREDKPVYPAAKRDAAKPKARKEKEWKTTDRNILTPACT